MVNRISKKNFSLVEQARLLKILGELIQKGYPLIQAIEFLSIQFPTSFRNTILSARHLLINGHSFIEFAKSMRLHPDVIVYLYFAEKHGDLSFALREGSFMLLKKIQHRAYLRKVMGYPICLLLFLLFILIIFQLFIIPQYEMLFSTFQTDHHSFSYIYLQIIKRLPITVCIIFVIGLILFISYFLSLKKLNPISQMEKLIRVPLFKQFLLAINTYEFSMQLSVLLHAGFSIAEALKIMQNNDSRTFIKTKSKFLYNQIRNGEVLQRILMNDQTFHRDLILVIDHGMNNSTLAIELGDYADYLKTSLEEHFHRSLRFIQPIIFIFIASSILSIYVAILFPMFQLMNSF
ncbi:competence type IV pilus assembly protein ComGB [Bacillus sp. OAE603]|uniref:competence type IV pilus assembly protein ComGB n=1 Tax=Gottfriedia sp. OAE603 TaxID=2663872 RepID=UPI00178915F9